MTPTAHAIARPPTRAEAWLLAGITVLALVASFFIAKDRLTWLLEVVWAMVGLALISWRWSRFPLTRLLCWLLVLHALVLMFIGAKMLLIDVYKIPIGISLGVVAATIATTIALSLLRPPPPVR